MFRITCPDAEFLYNMTKCGKEYWTWRKPWFESNGIDWNSVRPVDALIREIATSRLRNYGWSQIDHDYQNEFENMKMEDFFEFICNDIKFDVEHVNSHINWWTFDKLSEILKTAGFSRVVRSKHGGSYCPEMQDTIFFDRTHPEMSLYVEAVK